MQTFALVFLLCSAIVFCERYEPTWLSLDSRPIPEWYDEAKFGIFVHWGVFSVPAMVSEWFWYKWKEGNPVAMDFMKKNYPPDFTYADFARDFHASLFDPLSGPASLTLQEQRIHDVAVEILVQLNSADVGSGRDLVGELAFATRNSTGLRLGFYHALLEWFHPLYVEDKENGFHTRRFPEAKTMPELYELVNIYKPDILWSDAEYEASSEYWNTTGFLAWLFNDSPVKDFVVTNDRWGNDTVCKHGGVLTCEDNLDPGYLLPQKWESCYMTDVHSWGYRRNIKLADVRPTGDLIAFLVRTISCGGNLLLNIGPTADGIIPTVFEERLRQIGQWLNVNGEAIFGTKPWVYQNDSADPDIWYTSKRLGHRVYALVVQPPGESVTFGSAKLSKKTTVTLLGYPDPLTWTVNDEGQFVVSLPHRHLLPDVVRWGFVLKMNKMANNPDENPVKPEPRTNREILSLWKRGTNERTVRNSGE